MSRLSAEVTGVVVLGYGWIEDVLATIRSRRESSYHRYPPPVSDREIAQFEGYARMLAGRYRFSGSGGDRQDVEQVALIACWKALDQFDPSWGGKLGPFVRERMKWRVLDYVRIRGDGQKALERHTVSLLDLDEGRDP